MKIIKVKDSSEIPENFTGIVEYPNEDKLWYKEGNLHREDGPAIISSNGTKYWYKQGTWHREDGPAIEYSDGSKEWFKEGERHREDGPAIEWSNGTKEWWLEGKFYYLKNIRDHVVLDHYQGSYNIMWYKLLSEDKVFEYPNIPGLIIK
jgi:hypothetical protein